MMWNSLLRKAYRKIPGKQPLYELIRAIGVPPQRLRQHLIFDGPFEVPRVPSGEERAAALPLPSSPAGGGVLGAA